MDMLVIFTVFWMTVVGVGAWMVSEELADRKRERQFFRQLRSERERMAQRYGFRLRD